MSEVKETRPTLDSVNAAYIAFEEELNRTAKPNTPEYTERDVRLKERTYNLLNIFKSRYNIPDIIELTEQIIFSEEFSGKGFLYFKTKERKFVTGKNYFSGFMKVVKPKIDFEKEVNPEGKWAIFGSIVAGKLLSFMGPLERIPIAVKIQEMERGRN